SAVVHEFAERFTKSYGIPIRFTDTAAVRIAEKAEAEGVSIRDYCARSFKDFQFGLKLIQQEEEFLLDETVVDNPDEWLSQRVVKNYKK
ncbi:MAG: ATP-dependent protease, partial [Verrucomicrobia bacterium]|nr:ATP-dependent protease [Verrucomicrobiota bacterium]